VTESDTSFVGSIPEIYERYLVPLIFDAYALDLARRVGHRRPSDVLEIAAGTGVVTRALAAALHEATIVATDLNQEMLDAAAATSTRQPVEWRQADALALPFPDEAFDAVVCQFGVMFFPDKPKAYAEVRRVLRPGGAFIFNVWDRIEHNELADYVTRGVATLFPDDPPQFLPRTPHGYNDQGTIAAELIAAGWGRLPKFETIAERSRAASPEDPAIAFAQGTPLLNEIVSRDASRVAEATEAAARAVAERFGTGAVDAKMQAIVVTIEK
jgi:SAM-dependent methyltransferase